MTTKTPFVEFEGKSYSVTGSYKRLGKTVLVCDTDELFGD